MSQEEVLKVLQKRERATAEEIAFELQISIPAVWTVLNKMMDKDVQRIVTTAEKNNSKKYYWKIKK